ncbi:Hypothetical predicted protein, partial [Pelobates cultripes]
GTIKSKPIDVAEVFEDFYKRLYNHTPDGNIHNRQEMDDILKYLHDLGMTKLNREAIRDLPAEITEDEVDRAISGLK